MNKETAKEISKNIDEEISKALISSMCGGKFNNQYKNKMRYVQQEKALGFKYGARRIKGYEDSPARCQRQVRSLRKIKGFEKVTHIWC